MDETSTKDPIAEAPSAARAAALWWADQVGAPVYKNVDSSSSREDQRDGDFAGMLMTVISSRHPVNDEMGAKFAEALENTVAERLERGLRVTLGVDYGPDRELADAADVAGVNYSRFPWKTVMWVREDQVTVSLGYRGAERLIWTATGWVHPICGSQRYDEVNGDYVSFDETCGLMKYHDGDHGNYQPDTRKCAGCDLTYTGHYAKSDKTGYTHSWEPTS